MEQAEAFRILLVHDGDLAFVAKLLREFGAPFEERVGGATREDRQSVWNLVVASATRMREVPAAASKGVRIAILNEDSRTLRAMLRRLGVDLMVRRPVHPAAFRLLMLHALYHGPERRQSLRASVGAAIRIRLGLRKHDAILLDVSYSGCRVMSDVVIAPAKRLKVYFPPELAGSGKLALKGSAVRTETVETPSGKKKAVGIVFDTLKEADRERLVEIVAQHQSGPATMAAREQEGVPVPPEQTVEKPISTSSQAPPRRRKKPRRSRTRVTAAAVKEVRDAAAAANEVRDAAAAAKEVRGAAAAAKEVRDAAADKERRDREDRRDTRVDADAPRNPGAAPAAEQELAPEEAGSGAERRKDSRHSFERRVIVLSEEAARVLLGRDLAAGGMRVNADSNLSVGDRLRIALHVRSGEVPLVVNAKVLRDDGERGVVLGFEDLNDADRSYLEKMVGTLPVVSGGEAASGESSGDDSGGVVVTEILERG